MRHKIFLVLLLCALQQVYGSSSTKKKGESRSKKWAKNCLIALAVNYGANEVVDAGKPQAAEPNYLVCKYNVPDKNAGVMMNFVKCAKDQFFENYMFDNSENCPNIKELYKQAESDTNCALNTPKNISDGALARFRGEKLTHAANVEMLIAYLLSYSDKDGSLFKSEESLSDTLHEFDLFPKTNFDFFQFSSILELTKIAYPDSARWAISTALHNDFKDINADNAKRVLELTKLIYPDNEMRASLMVLNDYKDVNGDNANKVFELTKLLGYPNDKTRAVLMALEDYKDVNGDNAKKLHELTKLAYPDDERTAARMALIKYKDANADNARRVLEFTKLIYPDIAVAVSEALKAKYKDCNVDKVNEKYEELKNSWLWWLSSEQSIMKKALKITYPEILKEDF